MGISRPVGLGSGVLLLLTGGDRPAGGRRRGPVVLVLFVRGSRTEGACPARAGAAPVLAGRAAQPTRGARMPRSHSIMCYIIIDVDLIYPEI